MSAAAESLVGRRNIPVPERSTYIPAWYEPHPSPGLISVLRDGKPMGFTVEQVLPERRWAVTASGELMTQELFEKTFKKFWAGFGTGDSLDCIPIPNVHDFVDREPDAEGHLVKIGFNPNKPPVTPLEAKYTQDGELWADKMERLTLQQGENAEAMKRNERVKQLGELLATGDLTAERFAEKVAEAMGTPIPVLISKAPEREKAQRHMRAKVAKITMACGKEIDPRGRNWHKKGCEICAASPAPEAG